MRKFIGDTSYTQAMNLKVNQYNNLVRQAEILNRDNEGNPTKEEGTLYLEASRVCTEIMNLNTAQRAVYTQWRQRKLDCEAEVRRIATALAPPPVKAPECPAPKEVPSKAVPSSAPAVPGEDRRKSTQSKSGFTTKNASKDVPAEMIEKWYKPRPSHSMEDVAGMQEQKDLLERQVGNLGWERIDEVLGINPVQSFFFYGPAGCGKTFLIEAFAAQLVDHGFRYIRLLGGDIHQSYVGMAEKVIETAFQEAVDNEPCVIFIDEVESVCVNRNNPKAEGHEKRLTVAFLEAYNVLRESKKRVIFMGATNYPTDVDGAMLDRTTLVRVPLPPVEARENFFARKFRILPVEEGFSFREMAEATENYSFRDLDRLADALLSKIRMDAIARFQVTKEDGTVDKEPTDIAGSDAIRSGVLPLTRALFQNTQQELPPSDKTAIQEELDAFEERIRRNG